MVIHLTIIFPSVAPSFPSVLLSSTPGRQKRKEHAGALWGGFMEVFAWRYLSHSIGQNKVNYPHLIARRAGK